MKVTIRKGMFETNSSSMHSVILSLERNWLNNWENSYPEEEYWIDPSDETYSRQEGRFVIEPLGKLKFIYALYLIRNSNDKSVDCNLEEFKDRVNRVCEKYNVNVKLLAPKKNKYSDYPFINQEGFYGFDKSEDIFKIINDDKSMERFIFDGYNMIILGGDEYCTTFDLNYIVKHLFNFKSKIISNCSVHDDPIDVGIEYAVDYWEKRDYEDNN